MTDLGQLEEKIVLLEKELVKLRDREEIKELRHKYWRCMRDRLADEVMDCFSKEAKLSFGFGIVLEGKKAIYEFYSQNFKSESFPRLIPQGHNPEIEMTSDTTAKGIWLLDVMSIEPGGETGTRNGVQYNEWYVKEPEGWRINKLDNTYLYWESVTLKKNT